MNMTTNTLEVLGLTYDFSICRNNWLQKGGLNGAWTQFALNWNHQQRQKYISTDKAVLYWFTLIYWATSSSPLNKPFKRFHYLVNSYNEYTNLSRLQRVHKPLQVITSTQTSPGYTSLNLPLRSRPLKIEINTLKRENNESSQGFTSQWWRITQWFQQPKTLYALYSRLTINTQYIFFNVLYDVFLFLLLLVVFQLELAPLYVAF